MSKIQSINPWNGKVIKEFAPLSPGEIETKLELSESTFQSWKRIPVSERASLIKRAGEILRKNKEEYARLITLEMGKIIRESRAEVEKCAWRVTTMPSMPKNSFLLKE